MINRKRLIDEFLELVGINSHSRNEREIADILKLKLTDLGFSVYEDNTGDKIGGNTGNLIAFRAGNPDIMPVILNAHIDTVEPTENINVIVEDGVIKTDGSTILGADDKAGVASILEGVRSYLESAKEHGDIQIVFTVSEEVGLEGANNLDYNKISDGMMFAFDSGKPVCCIVTAAPSHATMTFKIYGKACHAGMCPENGINAIVCAAKAIAGINVGRIDFETTANIGKISGGKMRNIVPDYVEVLAEARSRDDQKLKKQVAHMVDAFEIAAKEMGARLEYDVIDEYQAFKYDMSDDICQVALNATKRLGVQSEIEMSGGGFDANAFNKNGKRALVVGTGYENVHSPDEFITIEDLVMSANLAYSLIETVSDLK